MAHIAINGIRVTADRDNDGNITVNRTVDTTGALLSSVPIPAEAVPALAPVFGAVDATLEHAPDPTLVEVAEHLAAFVTPDDDDAEGVSVVELAERAAAAATTVDGRSELAELREALQPVIDSTTDVETPADAVRYLVDYASAPPQSVTIETPGVRELVNQAVADHITAEAAKEPATSDTPPADEPPAAAKPARRKPAAGK